MGQKQTTSVRKKIPWVELISVIGALSWIPFIYDLLQQPKIDVKIISQYENHGKAAGVPSTLLVYKLAVVSSDKSFNLYDIKADVNVENYGTIHFETFNPRITVFTDYNNVQEQLNVDKSLYLNNYIILKKDEPTVGYLLMKGPPISYHKFLSVTFIFMSFKGDSIVKKINLENIDNKLLYDDDIWSKFGDTSLKKLPNDLQKDYNRDMNPTSHK